MNNTRAELLAGLFATSRATITGASGLLPEPGVGRRALTCLGNGSYALMVAGALPKLAFAAPFAAAASICARTRGDGLLGWGPFRFLGDISYTVYLAHVPVLMTMQRFWEPRSISNPRPSWPASRRWGRLPRC